MKRRKLLFRVGSVLPSWPLIFEPAETHRPLDIPADHRFAEVAGLMAYGQEIGELAMRPATTVRQLLDGANASDVSIDRPIVFEALLDLATAAARGLATPPAGPAQVDEVIA